MASFEKNSRKENFTKSSQTQEPSENSQDIRHKPSLATPRSEHEKRYMTILRYFLGGLVTWGVVGWIGSVIFNQVWILLLGLFLGTAGGAYLAYKHNLFVKHSSQDEET